MEGKDDFAWNSVSLYIENGIGKLFTSYKVRISIAAFRLLLMHVMGNKILRENKQYPVQAAAIF